MAGLIKRKINRIMLISPRYTLYKNDVRRCLPPIGLTYLAAFLENDGYEVAILDAANEGYYQVKEDGDFITYGLSDQEIKKRLADFNPQVAGVSIIFSTQSDNGKDILELIKEVNPEIITLSGGSHPTYAANEMLDCPFLDYIILGEGELALSQFLFALNNDKDVSEIKGLAFKKQDAKIINNEKQYVEDINVLPFPALHLLNMEKYFEINLPQNPYPLGKRVAQIITSRGCSARCIFCTTTNFWGNRYRPRTAENVVGELQELKERYNIDEIQFTDDNITLDKKRALAIFEAIKKFQLKWCVPQGIAVWALDDELLEKARETGCYQLTFAIESGNQDVLSKIIKKPLVLSKVKPLVKKAKKLGIKVHAFCICGLPGETKEQMQETYDFALDCGFDSASFFAATPLIGSELLSICQAKGYLRENITCNEQLYKIGNITTPQFTAQEVQDLVAKFNRDYNSQDTREKRFEKGKY